jgi:hypothetical protein
MDVLFKVLGLLVGYWSAIGAYVVLTGMLLFVF